MRCIFPVESKYLDQLVRISGACGNHAPFRLIYILCIFVRAASCFAIFPDAQRRMPFFILQKSWYKRENTSKVSSYIQSQYFIPNGLSANAYGTMVLSFWPRLFFPPVNHIGRHSRPKLKPCHQEASDTGRWED